ncbi:hypothetical protein HF086_000277 [Spodoptera exigua]|uniref:Apoptosis-inducing factor 1, mitochondrial n=1 Tax=Spodoptera exigua TaxID=7107 RepID=A0A922SBY6_SPOEX|nr:hypothetical protein HF086_000277 [Spodoptera exigua]
MLRARAVSAIYIESQALELFSAARKDVYKLFRESFILSKYCCTSTPASCSNVAIIIFMFFNQTVLTTSRGGSENAVTQNISAPGGSSPSGGGGGGPSSGGPGTQPPRHSWKLAATALTLSASLGGVYLYRKLNEEKKDAVDTEQARAPSAASGAPEEPEPVPGSGSAFPAHVQYLLVGAGTASFAAMRAIRSARPDARVLLVGAEHELPYMRPPLSKELWREPDLAARAPHLDALSFRQWNGRRRAVAYEPAAFYADVEQLKQAGGAAVARGWRVVRLDAARHLAELRAPGREPVTLRYDKCLLATGLRARRCDALRDAAAAGRALALRGPAVRRVAVLGGGFLACELSAALAERLAPEGRTVTQLFREPAPLAGVLPPYLAAEAARRLRAAGVALRPGAELLRGELRDGGVALRLATGDDVAADLVVECVGSEVDDELARASGLETHPELGGLLVNAELQARSDVYAAGDVACFYDVVLGRRRVEHHDHAVVSGRLAGENMAALGPAKHYTHQSMFWSDLGPQLGYEAIGIIDSRLPTVGVFSADAVTEETGSAQLAAAAGAAATVVALPPTEAGPEPDLGPSSGPSSEAVQSPAESRRYERGVVFYLRERRVVGVLLWNLFNRMHVARQVRPPHCPTRLPPAVWGSRCHSWFCAGSGAG